MRCHRNHFYFQHVERLDHHFASINDRIGSAVDIHNLHNESLARSAAETGRKN